jgi:hypothetical protein
LYTFCDSFDIKQFTPIITTVSESGIRKIKAIFFISVGFFEDDVILNIKNTINAAFPMNTRALGI